VTITPLQTSTDFQTSNGSARPVLNDDVSEEPGDIEGGFARAQELAPARTLAPPSLGANICFRCARDWR
jgi:hypothetical protein